MAGQLGKCSLEAGLFHHKEGIAYAGIGYRPGYGDLRLRAGAAGTEPADPEGLCDVHYGAVFTDKDMLPERRLNKIYEELTELIQRFRPDFMSVEKLFFNRNVTTAIAVGEARGVILLTAAQAGIPVYGYTPIQVKQAITGTGRANKEQVTYMVQKLLHIEEKPKPDDVADALAIGITGLNFIREQELRERMR